jgi:hypothetical protein
MDRFPCGAALAAVLVSFALTACGGGSSSTPVAAPSGGASSPSASILGVTTPKDVAVVTAKRAP